MADANVRTPSQLWIGLLLGVAALVCNLAFFLNPPVQGVIPWLSLVLAVAALLLGGAGLWRAFATSRPRRAKVVSSILALISLPLAALSVVAFFHSRAIPASSGAPHLGQKAPDFTLRDSNGQPLSLVQLFAAAPADPDVPTKAVLLIFYRGYW